MKGLVVEGVKKIFDEVLEGMRIEGGRVDVLGSVVIRVKGDGRKGELVWGVNMRMGEIDRGVEKGGVRE